MTITNTPRKQLLWSKNRLKMKKLLFSACLLASFGAFAQQENTIPQSGNVGIGTTNPSAKLDVNGSAVFDSTVVIKDSLEIQKSLRVKDKMEVDKQAVFKDKVTAKKNLVVKKNARIEKNLRVQVNLKLEGLTNLDSLQNGEVLFIGGDNKIYRVNWGDVVDAPYLPIDCKTDVNGLFIPENPKWITGTEKLYTGTDPCTGYVKVGIGTNSPESRLDIRVPAGNTVPAIVVKNSQNNKKFLVDSQGLVRAREIKVDAFTWPDYVFEEDYVLMPLSEVKEYIAENGHLPNVPSAEEVENEGQSLGEMNKILLEKVEELTLHLIRQQEELEKLKKNIQSLQK